MMHLGHLSVSGAGLLLTEATAVNPQGRLSKTDLGPYSDENEAAFDRVIAFCRRHGGAKLGIQLYHGGRKSSISTVWEGQKAISIDKGGWTTYSATDTPIRPQYSRSAG
jgi:2,4-dienoyl-CoA reductase-like NADH-dependent reductase (Old Yellow Enzyme family)